MKLTEDMVSALNEIRGLEPVEKSIELDLPGCELGNKLIELYYHSDHQRTRTLIKSVLTKAGSVWMRKLATGDTSPTAAPNGTLASLTDYLAIITMENASFEGATGWR